MSGIVGVVFKNESPLSRNGIIARMLEAAPHRGTDGDSVSLGNVHLAAQRDRGFADASAGSDEELAAVWCGEMDNRADLEREVRGYDRGVADLSDAELLIAAFRRFGTELPGRLRGVFAAAITDGETVWCFRDHIGFRSLFYHEGPTGWFLASEVKQIVAGARLPARADRDVVERIFFGDYDDDMPSAIQGVSRLDKATLLTVGPAGTSRSRYWDPARYLETLHPSNGDLQERFDALMTQAARRTLKGHDVISLSGGIDSPTVAAYAAPVHEELFGAPLPALSIVAPRFPSVDESEYIQAVVDRFGLPWHTFEQEALTGGDLERWGMLCDGPVPTVTLNEIQEFFSTARDLGFRNILTGELAEFVVDRPEGLLVHLLQAGRWTALARQIRTEREGGTKASRVLLTLGSFLAPRGLIVRHQKRRRERWACPPWLDSTRVAAGWARHVPAPRHRWRDSQIATLQGPGLTLEAMEICEMLGGIRVRRPWMDIDLWEFFLSLPAEIKYQGPRRKSIVRRLARGTVPDVILDRENQTVFDASIRDRLDYDELHRWLDDPESILPGVDYPFLRKQLESRSLNLVEYRWARDLAATHAFLHRHDG